jgi:hypothetical protein
MFLAPRWHVRSVEQTIRRAGEKMPKLTMPWICRTRSSITTSSLNRSLDHLEDPRSKEFGGSLQSSLLLRLSRSISMLLTEFSTLKAQPCHAANALLQTPTPQRSSRRQSDFRRATIRSAALSIHGRLFENPVNSFLVILPISVPCCIPYFLRY